MSFSVFRIFGRTLDRAFQVKPYEGHVNTRTGAFRPMPDLMSFPILKTMLVMIPGLWLGASISKYGAAFLEEHDIFVPSDDDDD